MGRDAVALPSFFMSPLCSKGLIRSNPVNGSLPKIEMWELLGLLLTAGGSLFGLISATPSLATLALGFRGVVIYSASSQASLGLAALALTALGSFTGIFVAQLKPPGSNIGALVIIWTDFVVLLIGDALFYLGLLEATTVMLVGLATAVLTVVGLLVIVQRPLRGGF